MFVGHDIVSVSTGKNHSLFLTSEGKVLVCGDNGCGQPNNMNFAKDR